MPSNIVFPEWLNANSVRNYPIQENATRQDVSGKFIIPNDLLVAIQVNFSRDYLGGTFYIGKVSSGDETVSITLSFQAADLQVSPVDVVTVAIKIAQHTPYSHYSFVGDGLHSAVVGSIGVGELSSTRDEGLGLFEFSYATTPLEVNCLFISTPALKNVEVYSGTTLMYVADQILKLRAGRNIKLTYEGEGTDTIRIDAISGENLTLPSECENARELPPCIRTINGVAPNEDGELFINGSDCISIEELEGGLVIKDLCSKSCCGCDELQQLMDGLQAVKDQEVQLRELIRQAQSQQSDMIAGLISNMTY